MEMFEIELEAMMLSKSFEELTPTEQDFVLMHITEMEYTRYYFILNNAISTFDSVEEDLLPNPEIIGKLRHHYDAKFLPRKRFFSFNYAQFSYGSFALVAVLAIVYCFFLLNRPADIIRTQQNKPTIVRVPPKEVKENLEHAKRELSISVKTKSKKHPGLPISKVEDSLISINTEPPGLRVYEPLLCIDANVEEQILCLDDKTLSIKD